VDRKNNIIEVLAKEKTVETLCTNMGVEQAYIDDLVQEIYLILLEYDEDKLIKMFERKQLKFFIVRIIMNQYFSKNSPFYKKYKMYDQKQDYNKEIETEEDEFNTEDRE
jgi:hypothetical protein